MKNKTFKELQENLLYDPNTKIDFLDDEKSIIDAFMINFVGLLLAYNLSNNPAKILRHIKADAKVRVSNIDDTNNDMSLIIKVMADKDFFKTSITVNEITRFFAILKTGKIKEVDEGQIFAWVNAVKPAKMVKMQKSLKKALKTILDDGDLTLGLKHIRWSAMRNASASGEFLVLTKGMKFKQVNKSITATPQTVATSSNQVIDDIAKGNAASIAASVAIAAPPKLDRIPTAIRNRDPSMILRAVKEDATEFVADFISMLRYDKITGDPATLEALREAYTTALGTTTIRASIDELFKQQLTGDSYKFTAKELLEKAKDFGALTIELPAILRRTDFYDPLKNGSRSNYAAQVMYFLEDDVPSLGFRPSTWLRKNIRSLVTGGINGQKNRHLINNASTVARGEVDVFLDIISNAVEVKEGLIKPYKGGGTDAPFPSSTKYVLELNINADAAAAYDPEYFRGLSPTIKVQQYSLDDPIQWANKLYDELTIAASGSSNSFQVQRIILDILEARPVGTSEEAVFSIQALSQKYNYNEFMSIVKYAYSGVLQNAVLAAPAVAYLLFNIMKTMIAMDKDKSEYELIYYMMRTALPTVRVDAAKIIKARYKDPRFVVGMFSKKTPYGDTIKMDTSVLGGNQYDKWVFDEHTEIGPMLFKEYVKFENVNARNLDHSVKTLTAGWGHSFMNADELHPDKSPIYQAMIISSRIVASRQDPKKMLQVLYPELIPTASTFLMQVALRTIEDNSTEERPTFFKNITERLPTFFRNLTQAYSNGGLIDARSVGKLTGYSSSVYSSLSSKLIDKVADYVKYNNEHTTAQFTGLAYVIQSIDYLLNAQDKKIALKMLLDIQQLNKGSTANESATTMIFNSLQQTAFGQTRYSEDYEPLKEMIGFVNDDPELKQTIIDAMRKEVNNPNIRTHTLNHHMKNIQHISRMDLTSEQTEELEGMFHSITRRAANVIAEKAKSQAYGITEAIGLMTNACKIVASNDDSGNPIFGKGFVQKTTFNRAIGAMDGMPNNVMYRELRSEIMPMLANTLRKNSGEIEEVYDNINNKYKKEIAGEMINERAMKTLVEDKIEGALIKPLQKVTEERLVEILKFNNIDVPGKNVAVKDVRSYKDLIDYTTNAVKNVDLDDQAIEQVEMNQGQLDKLTTDMYRHKRNNKHGAVGVKILRVFKANVPVQQQAHDDWLAAKPTQEIINPMYHGTGSVAASIILRNGFAVIKSGDSSVVGRMLGDGVYGAIHIDKSQQYIGDEGFTRNEGTIGYLFGMNAALGEKTIDYQVAGLGTGDRIRSPEWCVFTPNSQLRIQTVYEVEIITEGAMDQLLKDNPNTIAEDRKSFGDFLTEAKRKPVRQMRYTFVNGRVPTGDNTYVEFEDFKSNKNVFIEFSAYGPTVVINNTKENGTFMYKSPTEFAFQDTNRYNLYLKLLKKNGKV
jgi:hypothetical protein